MAYPNCRGIGSSLVAVAALGTICILAPLVRRQEAPPMPGGCGPASLRAVCSRMGLAVTLDEAARLSGGVSNESTFADLQDGAVALGLRAEGALVDVEFLRREKPLGILHIDGSHFVALVGYEAAGARVADPLTNGEAVEASWTYRDLENRWNGRMLILRSR